MSRKRSRISRTLIGVLLVTIVLGVFAYFNNTSDTKADAPEESASSTPAPQAAGVDETSDKANEPADKPAVVVTQTPSPVQMAMLNNPPPAARQQPAQTPASPEATAQAMSAGEAFAAADKMNTAGDLLGARKVLNDALVSNRFTGDNLVKARNKLAEINQTLVFSPRKFADDPFGGTYSVRSGDSLAKIAANHDITWELLGRLNGISDPRKLRAGVTLKVVQGPFHAVVSKSRFTMDLYFGAPGGAGSVYVTTLPVGLGADDSTPTGTWEVEKHKKIKNPTYFSPRGEGVIEADDPKNPLGEFWIGLTGIDGHAVGKSSYGIHGTIEPDSIGKMESMGCIRLRDGDIDLVYEMLVEGKSHVLVTE